MAYQKHPKKWKINLPGIVCGQMNASRTPPVKALPLLFVSHKREPANFQTGYDDSWYPGDEGDYNDHDSPAEVSEDTRVTVMPLNDRKEELFIVNRAHSEKKFYCRPGVLTDIVSGLFGERNWQLVQVYLGDTDGPLLFDEPIPAGSLMDESKMKGLLSMQANTFVEPPS